jgi:hypothetical protein
MKCANSRYFPFNWRAIGAAEDGVRQFMALKGHLKWRSSPPVHSWNWRGIGAIGAPSHAA